MNHSLDREVAIFTEALQLPVGERATYLDHACGGDAQLRQSVQALLDVDNQVGDFLEQSTPIDSTLARLEAVSGEKPGDRIGRYTLIQQIGEGGCGVVYMAEQEEPVRRRVALKIIKPGMDSKSVIARFKAEQQALALMDHPSIAKVFDAGATDSGRPFFVMELVRGIKITDYCDQNSLTTGERLKLFVQVCEAIQHAHQKGVIHRDIKPSNVLVTTTAEDAALPVVIDFGIAKATTNQRLTDKTLFTAVEILIGTPAYMSPEQAALTSGDVDTRTDIYSLGILLYELLTGSTPFDAAELLKVGLDEIRRLIREQEPGRPSARLSKMTRADLTTLAQNRKSEPPTLIHAIRGDLDWIVMKALEKDRARRYATSHGLALDVQRYLTGEPVLARPPSKVYRFRKAVLRNKILFAGLGVIGLLLVLGLIVVSASLAKERRSRLASEAASVKSQEVTRFLEDMLKGVGPAAALGEDTKMLRRILDQTAQRVGKQITNQPAVESELRSLIGTLYYQIGNYDQAESMHRAALAMSRRLFGLKSPAAAGALADLSRDLMSQGNLAEAEEVNKEALAIRQRLFGTENVDTASSLNDLANVYRQSGRTKEAEALARDALEIRRKLLGEQNLEVADSLRNLSIILGDQHKWAEAEALAREVLAMRRELLGSEHPWVATSLTDVAWAAGGGGKLDEAEILEQEALALRQKLLGEQHPDVAKSLYLVGDRMLQRGNLNEAYSVLSAALSIQRKLLGQDNPASLDTLRSLGKTLEGERKWSEAVAAYREVLAGWRRRVGDANPQTLYAMRNLGLALKAQGKLTEAETVHREELAAWRKRAGDEDPQSLYAMDLLASTLEAQMKFSEAEATRNNALAVWRKRAGNEDPQTLYALRNLAAVLDRASKWPEAEVAHREALAGWRNRAGNEDPQTLYTLDRLGWTLECEGKWSDAEAVYREALAAWRKRAGNEDPQTLFEWERLTHVLMEQKRFREAEGVLEEALTPVFTRQPSSAGLLVLRIDLKARRGQWYEAAADASLALEYQPASPRYAMVTALFLKTHNLAAYERLCKRMFAALANTTDPYTADQVAKSCFFLPSSEVDLQIVARLADLAVTKGSGDKGALPFYQDGKAFAEYRLGHYSEAVEWAQKPLAIPGLYVHGHSYAVLAMAYWHLGQKDEARAMLAKGNALEPPIMPASVAENPSNAWQAWLYARIQLDEASALIQP